MTTTATSDAVLRRRTVAEMGLVSAGKILSLGSLVLCNLAVARASADPGEYGRYAAGLSLALILDAAIGFPLDISTVRFSVLAAGEPSRVDRVQAAAFRFKVLIGIVLVGAAALSGSALSRVVGHSAGPGLISVALVCTLALLCVRSTAVRLQIAQRFTRYAVLDAVQGVLRLAAISVPIVLGHRSAEAFLLAHAGATASTFLAGFWLVPQKYLRSPWPGRADLREAAIHVSFMAGIVVLGTITGRADVPILAAVRSTAEAGQYAVGLQVAMLLTMLASYASVVMQPRVIQMARDGQVRMLLKWNLAAAAATAVLLVPIVTWVLPALIPSLFGSRYAGAVAIAAVLIVGTCADLISMPVLMMFSIQVMPGLSLAGEIAITAAYFSGVAAGAGRAVMTMAWLATAVRLAKLTLYFAITVGHLDPNAVALPSTAPLGLEPRTLEP